MTGAALVLRVVDTSTQKSHLVGIDVAALHRRSGRYPALCGAEVCSASLTTEPSQHCRECRIRAEGGCGGAAQRRRVLSKIPRLPRLRWFGRHAARFRRTKGNRDHFRRRTVGRVSHR